MRSASLLFGVMMGLAFAVATSAQVTYTDQPPPPPPPQYQPPYPPGQQGYGRPGYPGNPNDIVSCGSPQHRMLRCPVPNYWRGARIVRQTSHAACVEGQTWGFDRGCGGQFVAAGGWQPSPGWNRDFMVSCGSPQYRRYFCQVDVGARGRVVLQRQYSDAACVEGRTWGWNRAGIWVDKGCGGHFLVTRRW